MIVQCTECLDILSNRIPSYKGTRSASSSSHAPSKPPETRRGALLTSINSRDALKAAPPRVCAMSELYKQISDT